MVWEYEHVNVLDEGVVSTTYTEYLGEEIDLEGEKAMPLLLLNDGNEEDRILAYIKTDGDVIYARSADGKNPNWYKIYDFGLKIGEGTYITAPRNDFNPEKAFTTYLVCRDRVKSSYGDWTVMSLDLYKNENLEIMDGRVYHGDWIVGIGNRKPLLDSNVFDDMYDGYMTSLLKAEFDGIIVYDRDASSDVQSISAEE